MGAAGADGLTLVFDADDTLWENNVLFNRVVDDFIGWVAHPTLDRHAVRAVLHDVEVANTAAYGYGSRVFLRTLHDCFEQLSRRPVTGPERAEIEALARALTEHRVELVPEVAATLLTLGRRHTLFLLTKGDAAEQQSKVDASGLAHHFTGIHIVPEKNVDTYLGLTRALSLDPATTWMIGNSPKSDILPARAAGWRAVFIPNDHTWALERADLDHRDEGVVTVASFPDLVGIFEVLADPTCSDDPSR